MNEIGLRSRTRSRLTYQARGNGWHVFPVKYVQHSIPDVLLPETWVAWRLETGMDLLNYEWRLVSPEGAILAEMKTRQLGRRA